MLLDDALGEFVLDAQAAGNSPSTIRWYDQRLSRLIRFLVERDISEVDEATISHLRAFVASLRSQTTRWTDHPYHPPSESSLSPYTVHGYVRATRAFFRWLFDEEIIDANPARRLKLPPLPKEFPKAIATDDREKLLEVAASDPRDHAMACFLIDTACRVGGLVGLKVTDLSR
jgi:site-specific recombinase XerD